MNVLWLVNIIFPYPAKKIGMGENCFGGWLPSMYLELSKNEDINFCIVTSYSGDDLKKFKNKNTTYYLVPDKNCLEYSEEGKKYYREIVSEFHPDIVHIHGTEYPRGLIFQDCNFNIPVVTSIQGLISNVSNVYYSNITFSEILKNITFRDILRRQTIFNDKKSFEKRIKYEREIIEKSNYVIGRTIWDKANVLSIVPDMKYFSVNECLRDAFYNNKEWNIDSIERHSIFCSQASYPIKGLHVLVKALYILKGKYPDVKLYIAGNNIIDCSSFKKKIRLTGYGKYIRSLVKKYDLFDNIEFTGLLNQDEIAKRYLKSNVFVLSSYTENESNSLSEAKILGVPSVCSYVGGVTQRVHHDEDGFLYPCNEAEVLAYYVDKIFGDDSLAKKFSKNSIKNIKDVVDVKKNCNEIVKIYNSILKDEV